MARGDPDHPIIDHAWEWSVAGLTYYAAGEVESDPCLDLRLRRGTEARHLRFMNPQKLQISGSFPHIGWLLISDIRSRGLEGLSVLVHDGEMSEAISFYAGSVKEVGVAA